MTHTELDQRARQRSIDERLHTFKVAGQALYLVRSRETEPGAMHQVRINGRKEVASCTCKGWFHRQSCTHAQAVERRLEREGRKSRPAQDTDGAVESASTTCGQLYRTEAGA